MQTGKPTGRFGSSWPGLWRCDLATANDEIDQIIPQALGRTNGLSGIVPPLRRRYGCVAERRGSPPFSRSRGAE